MLFTFHMRCIYIVRSLYFRIFSPYFLITFLSPEIATSITIHIPFSLSRIIMCGLLLGMVLSVAPVHSIIRLPYLQDLFILNLVSSHQCSLSNFIPISLVMLKCSWAQSVLSLKVVFFCQCWACWYNNNNNNNNNTAENMGRISRR